MGIQGLLPLINAALNTRHISHFKGKRVAVDGYAWLHKAVYGCSQDLALGKENFSWIKYCLKFIDMLLNYEISITMVFDGSNLPLKSETENIRKEKRERAKEKGLELLNKNDKNGARICFTGAVDITPFMAAQLIQILKQHRPTVNFLVAPYEADAQLAYLSINNQVDIVISEDSDTIPFGCKETIFKLNIEGHCQHLLYQDLFKNMENIDLSLFTHEMIIAMCVASGCDYLVNFENVMNKVILFFMTM
jgi:exonuclease-1